MANYRDSLGNDVKRVRVGILHGYFEKDMAGEVKENFSHAVAVLRRLGMETEDVTIPHMDLIPGGESLHQSSGKFFSPRPQSPDPPSRL